jgi:hypothetical protein
VQEEFNFAGFRNIIDIDEFMKDRGDDNGSTVHLVSCRFNYNTIRYQIDYRHSGQCDYHECNRNQKERWRI